MAKITNTLAQVEKLLTQAQVQPAEDLLKGLLYSMGDQEARIWEPEIRKTIERFYHKRRKQLLIELEEKIGAKVTSPAAARGRPRDLEPLEKDLAGCFARLSARHIFQWSTYYRDSLGPFFEQLLEAASVPESLEKTVEMGRRQFEGHAGEIFRKGYEYVSAPGGSAIHLAVHKSSYGLQRFLELPIEFYSSRLLAVGDTDGAKALRSLCSSLLTGILTGYGNTVFGAQTGWRLLPQIPRSWAHYLAFLSAGNLVTLLTRLDLSDFQQRVDLLVRPLVQAIDSLVEGARDYAPLPVLGQLVWDQRRLEVALRPPPQSEDSRLIEVLCFLDASYVNQTSLQEAARKDVGLILAPLRPDLFSVVRGNENLSRIVVAAGEDPRQAHQLAGYARSALEYAIFQRRSRPKAVDAPLTYNFAREFPLHNAFLTRYFRVYRSSVRDLLRTFERRNGARLWCSVRRSGKTTACFDLGTTTGDATIVSQTCDSTEQVQDANMFYDLVCNAIDSGQTVSKSFFKDAVLQCSAGQTTGRFVFVLDEYETFFGRLRAAFKRDPELRYTIIQPILNQMVAFTHDNLLVFLGQQPNAHHILMDQNQLSPYVEQDSFPLFSHAQGALDGEFAELVRKVLTDRVEFDSGFLDELYSETAGHPFLSVNVLISFVDWLIDQKRPLRELSLALGDFTSFADAKLDTRSVGASSEYMFFREAISEAISDSGRRQNPWLFAVYSALRQMALDSPHTFACSTRDFESIALRLGIEGLGLTVDYLLATAAQANFLDIQYDTVRPKIRALGRIAGISRKRIS